MFLILPTAMSAILRNHPIIVLCILMFGLLSTLVLDLWATEGTWVEEVFLWIAFFPRIFTFLVLFVSCRLIAEELPGRAERTILLGSVWSLIGLGLAAVIWWHLAYAEGIHRGGAIRFTPDRPSLPDWLEGAVVTGRNYTWRVAITREAVGIAAVSFVTAYFLSFMAQTGRLDATYYSPVVSFLFLIFFYNAPWAFIWGPDVWIGDALLGAMIYNAIFFWPTICFGGLTGPAVWVALIAISNLVLLTLWTRDNADQLHPKVG